jgi:hypothetical protein
VPAKFCQMMPRVLRTDGERLDEAHEVVAKKDYIGAFLRHIRARAHSDADISFRKRRRVVHAVTDHDDDTPLSDQSLDAGQLVLRQ